MRGERSPASIRARIQSSIRRCIAAGSWIAWRVSGSSSPLRDRVPSSSTSSVGSTRASAACSAARSPGSRIASSAARYVRQASVSAGAADSRYDMYREIRAVSRARNASSSGWTSAGTKVGSSCSTRSNRRSRSSIGRVPLSRWYSSSARVNQASGSSGYRSTYARRVSIAASTSPANRSRCARTRVRSRAGRRSAYRQARSVARSSSSPLSDREVHSAARASP